MSLEQELGSVNADIQEFETLVSSAKRDSVKQILKGEIARLGQRKARIEKDIELQKAPKPAPPANLRTVSNFAWDQTKEFVKIYIERGEDPVEQSEIKLDFNGKRSFSIIFGNQKFSQSKLNADVDAAASYVKLTKSKVIIYLKKVKETNWSAIKETAESHKKAMEEEKDEMGDDPQAGLMKLMKKMYDEGDDEMKRTISKSWYESQRKDPNADPMNMMSGMGGL